VFPKAEHDDFYKWARKQVRARVQRWAHASCSACLLRVAALTHAAPSSLPRPLPRLSPQMWHDPTSGGFEGFRKLMFEIVWALSVTQNLRPG
jgi:hypothetical protein